MAHRLLFQQEVLPSSEASMVDYHDFSGLSTIARDGSRVFVPSPSVQNSTSCFWSTTAPLFEEEGHFLFLALISDLSNPFNGNRSMIWSALASNYCPRDSRKINPPNRAEQRFEAYKSCFDFNVLKNFNSLLVKPFPVLVDQFG